MGFTRIEPGLLWSPSKKKDAEGRTLGSAKLEIIKGGTRGHVRKRITLEKTTLGDAEKRLAEERARIDGDELPPPETFGEFVERYGGECLEKVAASTRKTYESALRHHVVPYFQRTKMSRFVKFTAYESERFAQTLRRKKKRRVLRTKHSLTVVEGDSCLTEQSVNGCLRILRILLRHAAKAGVIPPIPERSFKFLDEPKRDKTPRLDDLSKFFATFYEPVFSEAYAREFNLKPDNPKIGLAFEHHRWLLPLFVAAAETGWRRADLLDLRWSAVSDNQISIVMKKTGAEATAGITRALREALKELRGRTVVSKDHVFLGIAGRPLSATTVRRAFQLGVRLAGIHRVVTFHGFRHSAATRMIGAKVPTAIVQRALGHASIKTTELYLSTVDEHMQVAVEGLERMSWAK